MSKKYLDIDVLTAAKQRVSFCFDNFERICISFSGGKDSGVLLHLVMEEAVKRKRKVGVFFVDWEAQYNLTIKYITEMYDLYKDSIEPYWCCLPLLTTNACSQFSPEWICWEKDKNWVREIPDIAIKDYNYFPFYNYAMTFEEFVPKFGQWYSQGKPTAIFVGIRSDESLNRYRTIMNVKKGRFEGLNYTTHYGNEVYNVYPIYDWRTEDIWKYYSKFKKTYNKLYDRFYQAGLSIHQMRICEPYGDEQRKGIYLYHLIEPETWGKLVARVNGANSAALYAQESGNILGNYKVTKPDGHTWKSFCMLLLDTMPKKTSDHYKNKIAVYLKWCLDHQGTNEIPDEAKDDTGSKDVASWRRICKTILKNDYWCKGLSFSPQKNSAYDKYLKMMKTRRDKWGELW